jgi:hypothetical protein
MKKLTASLAGQLLFLSLAYSQNYGSFLGPTVNGHISLGSSNTNPPAKLYVVPGICTSAPIPGIMIESQNPICQVSMASGDALLIRRINATVPDLIVKNTGRVGIGTSSPASMFSIKGFTATSHYMDIMNSSGTLPIFHIRNTGNVGVGTSNPKEKLHIENGVIRVTGPNNHGGPMLLLGGNPATDSGEWGIEHMPGSGLNFWRPFGVNNFGNYFMYLRDSDGHVGINTDKPTARLTVNGNALIGDPSLISLPAGYRLYVQEGILTERVKVALKNTADWSDFVFGSDYKLTSLSEVEDFVTRNRHLPGVPSAKEMVENGNDLGKTDAILLQKIEELYLHVIRLQKEVDVLQAQRKGSE